MSMRVRLMAAAVGSLLISLLIGGTLAGWHAARSVRIELEAALRVGAQAVSNALGEADPAGEPARIVRSFDGDRHVRASLLDGAGRPLETSQPSKRSGGPPAWLVAALAPALPDVALAAGPGVTLVLAADPRSEVGEVWTQAKDGLLAASLFAALSVTLIGLTMRRALAPLDAFAAALGSLGSGHFHTRLPVAGARELAGLSSAFNTMSARLEAAEAQNERLSRQLAEIADEERRELARDLHDEVGSFLFAVRLDAATIALHAQQAPNQPILERAQAIGDAVVHMQHHVRSMLSRLRGADPALADLDVELEALVTFWRTRQPEVDFTLDVQASRVGGNEPARAVAYRVVQEGLTNAVRHGSPRRVAVTVEDTDDRLRVCIEDDGRGVSPGDREGWGLTFMRERLCTLGGFLHLGPGAHGVGWRLEATVPLSTIPQPA